MKIFFSEPAQSPNYFLTKAVKENKLTYACIGYAFGIISLYFAIKLGTQNTASLTSFLFAFIIWFLSNIVLNFVLAALCNLLLEMTDNKASALGIFILLGLSQLIWSLLVPCFIFARAFAPLMPWTALFVLAIFAAQIYFVLNSIKQIYGISKASSLFAFIFAFILPFAAAFCFVVFIVGVLISLLA